MFWYKLNLLKSRPSLQVPDTETSIFSDDLEPKPNNSNKRKHAPSDQSDSDENVQSDQSDNDENDDNDNNNDVNGSVILQGLPLPDIIILRNNSIFTFKQ